MNDTDVHEHIEGLVAEEHALFDKGAAMTAQDRTRLDAINVHLDRLWDVMRQRRAREEFDQDPDSATERPASVVESYLQ